MELLSAGSSIAGDEMGTRVETGTSGSFGGSANVVFSGTADGAATVTGVHHAVKTGSPESVVTREPLEYSGATAIGAPGMSFLGGVELGPPEDDLGELNGSTLVIENPLAVPRMVNWAAILDDLGDPLGRAEGDTTRPDGAVIKPSVLEVGADSIESFDIGSKLLLTPRSALFELDLNLPGLLTRDDQHLGGCAEVLLVPRILQ